MRLFESIKKTCIGNVSVYFYCDEDDPKEPEYKVAHITGPDFLFAMKCHILALKCDGDILMMCGDDAVFRTRGWDNVLRGCYEKWPDGIWCASFWDGTPGKILNDGTWKITHPHPAIGRGAFEVLGYLANPMFQHFCTDPWLTSMFEEIGRFEYFRNVRVDHRRAGVVIGVEKDETFRKIRPLGQSTVSMRDRTVMKLLERYRKHDVELLKSAMKEN